jgi:hypothetical protein
MALDALDMSHLQDISDGFAKQLCFSGALLNFPWPSTHATDHNAGIQGRSEQSALRVLQCVGRRIAKFKSKFSY